MANLNTIARAIKDGAKRKVYFVLDGLEEGYPGHVTVCDSVNLSDAVEVQLTDDSIDFGSGAIACKSVSAPAGSLVTIELAASTSIDSCMTVSKEKAAAASGYSPVFYEDGTLAVPSYDDVVVAIVAQS